MESSILPVVQHQAATTNRVHGEAPDGLECLVTMEDINNENYVEYQSYPSLQWRAAKMEQGAIEELLRTQFHTYIERVKKTDCQAELKRLLTSGPPIYISDAHGLPLALADKEGSQQTPSSNDTPTTVTIPATSEDTHIVQLWFASSNEERSAKLDGALEGEKRDLLWDELRQFVVLEGKEEGDDDDNE